MTKPDYESIAFRAVDLLCTLGFSGLHPSKQRELWQRALDLEEFLAARLSEDEEAAQRDASVHGAELARRLVPAGVDGDDDATQRRGRVQACHV